MCGYKINVSFFALSSLLSVSFFKLKWEEKEVTDEKNFKEENSHLYLPFWALSQFLQHNVHNYAQEKKRRKNEINRSFSEKTMHGALNTTFKLNKILWPLQVYLAFEPVFPYTFNQLHDLIGM